MKGRGREVGSACRLDMHQPALPIPRMVTNAVANVRIGTQGWNYDAWVGPFFPSGTRPADFLSIYARAFDTVEVDSTFYAIPAAKTVRGWFDRTPPEFTFALKMPQEITHEARLRGPALDLARQFFDRARELEGKLGPVLMQLGPDFAPTELPALASFLPELPTDISVAIEFRQRGWITEGILALLAEHHVALALTDARWIPRKQMLSLATRPTSDFAYLRWMGPNRDIVDYSRIQIDRSRELEAWGQALRTLAPQVRRAYGYVNNHWAGHSPQSARELMRLLGQPTVEPDKLGEQFSLF
jgi:uncharacterized protein YecE (DUF72 family)